MVFEIHTRNERAIVAHSNRNDALLQFCNHSDILPIDCLLIKPLSINEAIDAYRIADEKIKDENLALTLIAQDNHKKYTFICSLWAGV